MIYHDTTMHTTKDRKVTLSSCLPRCLIDWCCHCRWVGFCQECRVV